MSKDSPRVIQSVDKTYRIISAIQRMKGASLTEIAKEVDLSMGAVHTHLATLKQYGIVVQHETTYDLGPQLLALGESVRNHSELYRASKKQVEQLATDSGECAHLIIEHKGQLYALYERFGEEAVGVEYHSRKREELLDHLHCTAAGKAILAFLPEERVRAIIEANGLPKNTPETITTPDILFDTLERIRERGYSFADEEQMLGIRAVGAPIQDPYREVKGAIALSGPTSRLKGKQFQETIPELVMRAANICEVNLHSSNLNERVI